MKTNYEKLYLIQPQIYYKMLPLMNKIDKRIVEEINEEHNTDVSNLLENDSNPVVANDTNDFITKDNNMQNYLQEVERFSTIPDKFSKAETYSALPVDLSKMKSPIASETPSTLDQSEIEYPLVVNSSVNVPEMDHSRKIPSQEHVVSNLDDLEVVSETPNQINSDQDIYSSYKSKTKPKQYLCEICINRGFTTKYSLNRHNKNFHKLKKISKELINETKPSFTSPISQYNLERFRDLTDDETDEIQNFPDSKKLKTRGYNLKRSRDSSDELQNFPETKKLKARGLKRNADPVTIHEQHLPRKSARIESYKRKNQWTENSPAKRLAIQSGQGFSNWVNF